MNVDFKTDLIIFLLFSAICGNLQGEELLGQGVITRVDSQYNSTSWAAANLSDNDADSRWLSTKQANDINFIFNAAKDQACFSSLDMINYGGDDRSVKRFMLLRALDGSLANNAGESGWLPVPADVNPANPLNYLLWAQGGRLVSTDGQYNSTSWATTNMFDGDHGSRWLSQKSNNIHEFGFDTDWDGTIGDGINIESIVINNYGTDDRSVKLFQIEVSSNGTVWNKLDVPGEKAGDPDFNFNLLWEGSRLTGIDGQYNATGWAASNIHDGDQNSRWLSGKGNNTLTFGYDTDMDGNQAGVDGDDEFDIHKIYLENYGADDRSIQQFQVEVKTADNPLWKKLEVPGSEAGTADFNFLLEQEGGVITGIDGQYNDTGWAARNLHDGNQNTRWLNGKGNNFLAFQFDVNGDGVTGASGDVSDLFNIEKIYIQNYGSDDRSIKQFQVEVKSTSYLDWKKIEVPGTEAGDAGYEFSLTHNGAKLSSIDSQYNSTGWAASNIHDGDLNTRWLSSKPTNSLTFVFDADLDGVTGDGINVDTIEFVNYGPDDRSVATFKVDAKIGGGWVAVTEAGGGTVFSADMNGTVQSWAVGSYSGVTAVRFRSLTNHGDPSYTGAREFRVSGMSLGPNHTFVAAMHGNGQRFILDSQDQIANATEVRLRTISNHGDPSYIGAREFQVLGASIFPGHTFEAAMKGSGETFVLDEEDRVSRVTAVRFITINNHGDPSYIGARELGFLGPANGPGHVFSAPMTSGYHQINLDAEDVVSGISGARLITVRNHGDPQYTGLREFGLLGAPVGPDYVFYPQMNGSTQSFSFDPTEGNVLRFHPLSNYGDPSYTGVAELKLYGSLGGCCELGGFVVSQPANGIACPGTRAEIDVVAMCSDGVHVKADYVNTVQLTGPSGSSFFAASSAGESISEYTFNASDNGSARVYLFYDNVASDVKVSVTDADAALSATASTGTDFGAQGFRVFNQPTSTVCGLSTVVGIEAFGQVAGDSCQPLTEFSGSKVIKSWFDAKLDALPGFDDTSTPINVQESYCIDAELSGGCLLDEGQPDVANLMLNFVDGQSSLVISHADAAHIDGIHFRHDAPPYDGTIFSGLAVTTDSFVMSPEAIGLEIPGGTEWQANAGHLSSVFKKAGEEFSVVVSALCHGGTIAQHYVSQADITLSHDLALPVGGASGNLAITETRVDNTAHSGVKTLAQSVSEVGIFELTATLPANSYFGETINSATVPDVGRFVPDYLAMTANLPSFSEPEGCPLPGSWAFAYQGQPFPMDIAPQVVITGKNLFGATTQNYDGDFFKFNSGQTNRSYLDNTGTPASLSFIGGLATFTDAASFDGTKTLVINDSDFTYEKSNVIPVLLDAPFAADVTLSLAEADLQDSDGVCFQDGTSLPCRTLSFPNIGNTEIRYGRMRLENAFGPELSDLVVPISAEYWDGKDWLTNSADNCTRYDAASVTLNDYTDRLNDGETSVEVAGGNAGSAVLVNGIGDELVLLRPGAGNTGSVSITVGVDDWLEYDWDDDAATDNTPSSSVSFGQYRSHDRIIYWQEITD